MDNPGAKGDSRSSERYFVSRKMRMLTEEYNFKVTHDFTRYIFLGLMSNHTECLETTIDMLSQCYGYEAHRGIQCKEKTTHMYARFADGDCALAAVIKIKLIPGYVVDLVDNLLRTWYILELMNDCFPWTVALVDVEGSPRMRNDVFEDFGKFGDPHVHYSGFNRNCFQVLFSSMSEALGATIATGCWFKKDEPEKESYYTVKILTNSKEEGLVKSVLTSATDKTEAFQLDYFVPSLRSNPMEAHLNANEFIFPVEPLNRTPNNAHGAQYYSNRSSNRGRGFNHKGQRNNRGNKKSGNFRNSITEQSQEADDR